MTRLKARRNFWLDIYLWLGLLAGAVLLLIGLTGSVLVFWQELDAWLNPRLHYVQVQPEGRDAYLPLNDLLKAADATMPPSAQRSTIYYPRHEGLALWLFYQMPMDNPELKSSWDAFVNPYYWRGDRCAALVDFLFGTEWQPYGVCLSAPLLPVM